MVYTPVGNYDPQKAGHEESYYSQRHCNIDYRGNLRVSPLSYFGFFVTVITASHKLVNGAFDPAIDYKRVFVDDYAWITSNSILYNCHVMHHGIVSIGSVVSNMIVEPYTVVAGNPARPIYRWDVINKKWEKL